MMKMNRTSVRLDDGSGDHIATPEVSGLCYIEGFLSNKVLDIPPTTLPLVHF